MSLCFDTALRICAMPGEQNCGDTGLIREVGNSLSVSLVDVLGHGDAAAELADDIRQYLSATEVLAPLSMIKQLHEKFRGSRGMVVSNALFNTANNMLEYCGIGNITARIVGRRPHQFVNRDGVVGYRMVSPVAHQWEMGAEDVLIMHSDGMTSRFANEDIAPKLNIPADALAEYLMDTYGKNNDDTSCIVVKVTACH